MAQYVILEELGIMTKADLDGYCKPHGHLGAHPDYGLPGIEASTGSLGHGLPMAVGVCLANKEGGTGGSTYVVLSDGEMMEGSNWEAVMATINLKVTDLTAFVDLMGSFRPRRSAAGIPTCCRSIQNSRPSDGTSARWTATISRRCSMRRRARNPTSRSPSSPRLPRAKA